MTGDGTGIGKATAGRGARVAWTVLATVLLLAAGCASGGRRGARSLLDHPPRSWVTLDVARADARIARATRAGWDWVRSPVRIVLTLCGDDTESHLVLLRERWTHEAETPVVVVDYVRDGQHDDSVRGTWSRLTLRSRDDGSWHLFSWREAYRCWRDGRDRFRRVLCP